MRVRPLDRIAHILLAATRHIFAVALRRYDDSAECAWSAVKKGALQYLSNMVEQGIQQQNTNVLAFVKCCVLRDFICEISQQFLFAAF